MQELIFYTVDGVKGEDVRHPNAYFCKVRSKSSSSPILLRDIKRSFPLPGRYHFRFRVEVPAEMSGVSEVFADVLGGSSPVPLYRGSVQARVFPLKYTEEDDDVIFSASTNSNSTIISTTPALDVFAKAGLENDDDDDEEEEEEEDDYESDDYESDSDDEEDNDDSDYEEDEDEEYGSYLNRFLNVEAKLRSFKKIENAEEERNGSGSGNSGNGGGTWGALGKLGGKLKRAGRAMATEASRLAAAGEARARFLTKYRQFINGFDVGTHTVSMNRLLAEGGFSSVFAVTSNSTKENYALKWMICPPGERKILKTLRDEVELHQELTQTRCRNILRLIATEEHRDEDGTSSWATVGGRGSTTTLMLFPICQRGSLYDVLLQAENAVASGHSELWPFHEKAALSLLYGITNGMLALHSLYRSHRDLKPGNILLSNASPPVPLLMDFGSAKPLKESLDSKRKALLIAEHASSTSSAPYRAPELWPEGAVKGVGSNSKLDGAKSDVFSLGATAYAIAFGRSPFEPKNDGVLKLAILQGDVTFPDTKEDEDDEDDPSMSDDEKTRREKMMRRARKSKEERKERKQGKLKPCLNEAKVTFSVEFQKLIKEMCVANPEKRISMKKIKKRIVKLLDENK
eukprot:g1506.t1